MRKIYTKRKHRAVKEEAMNIFRQTRDSIDPELLERARQTIEESMTRPDAERQATMRAEDTEISANASRSGYENSRRKEEIGQQSPSHVPIDRKKNLQTILKFLKNHEGSSGMQSNIASLLKEL